MNEDIYERTLYERWKDARPDRADEIDDELRLRDAVLLVCDCY